MPTMTRANRSGLVDYRRRSGASKAKSRSSGASRIVCAVGRAALSPGEYAVLAHLRRMPGSSDAMLFHRRVVYCVYPPELREVERTDRKGRDGSQMLRFSCRSAS